jgi:cytochrome c-type biogenesis protein CcmF
MGVTFATLWGTLFPIFSELATNQKITVGPPFYNQVNGPLLAVIVLLMGIAPLVAWRKSSFKALGRLIWIPAALTLVSLVAFYLLGARTLASLAGYGIAAFVGFTTLSEYVRGVGARMRLGENPITALINLAARNRRRYGGYIIHLGVVVMAFGVVGSYMFQQETQASLKPGQTLALGGFTMRFDSLTQFPLEDGREVSRAVVTVLDPAGKPLGELYPRHDLFDSGQPMTIPGVRSTLGEDFYVLLVGWEPIASNGATFKVYLNPLINLVWLGGLVFIIGTLVAAWPDADEEKRYVAESVSTLERAVKAS